MWTITGRRHWFMWLTAAAFTAALMATSPVTAAPAGSTLPALQDLGLQKRGEGSLSFFGITLYSATLWTESAAGTPDPTAEPVLLQLDYERNIRRERIMKVTRKEWRRLDVAAQDQRQAWLQQLEKLLPDVTPGDQLSSLILPGRETRFYFGGTEIGRIEDPAFGSAFLAIWLDPRTRADELRDQLLTARDTVNPGALTPRVANAAQ